MNKSSTGTPDVDAMRKKLHGIVDKIPIDVYKRQVQMSKFCHPQERCCWVPLLSELKPLIIESVRYEREVLLALPLVQETSSRVQAQIWLSHLKELDAGPGTTGTHSIFRDYCSKGLRTVHFSLACPRGEKGQSKKYLLREIERNAAEESEFAQQIQADELLRFMKSNIDFGRDIIRVKNLSLSEINRQAMDCFLKMSIAKVEGIVDTGIISLFHLMLMLNPSIKVTLSFRTANEWAERRALHKRLPTCSFPWISASDPFSFLSCLSQPKPDTGKRMDQYINLYRTAAVPSGIGKGLNGTEAMTLAYILYNHYIMELVPKSQLNVTCWNYTKLDVQDTI